MMKLLLLGMILGNVAGLIFEEDLGELLPHNPWGIHGEYVNMTCTIYRSFPIFENRFNASDLQFNVTGHVVSSAPWVRVLNEDTAHLFYAVQASHDNSWVDCFVQYNATTIVEVGYSQFLNVGHRPHKAQIENVRIINWEKLVFETNKPENKHFVTNISSWWKILNDTEYKLCFHYEEEDDSPERRTCKVDNFEQYLRNNTENTVFMIKVNASNTAGHVEKIRSFNSTQYVKPNKVTDLTVSPSPNQLIMEWKPPKEGKELMYEISLANEWTDDVWVQEFPVERIVKIHLIPYTIYTVSVRCKSVLGGFWSEPETVSQRTKPDVPRVQPEMTPGVFHLKQTSTRERTATVYWKPVLRRYLHGPLKSYHVEYRELSHGTKMKNVTVSKDQSSITLKHLKTNTEYYVSVTVENSEGLSTAHPDMVLIPKQSLVRKITINMPTVIAVNETAFEVRWSSDQGNFTFFWCRNNLATEKTCQSDIYWSRGKPTLITDLWEGSVEDYQFGVAMDIGERYTGIQWIRCVYHVNKNAEAPRIRLVDQGETSLRIRLEDKPCQKLQGYVTKYLLKWCPLQKDSSRCPENAPHKYIDRTGANQFTIRDLYSDQQYLLQVASLTEENKTSFDMESTVERTKAPLGGLPKWAAAVIVVILVIIGGGLCCFAWCCWRKCQKCRQYDRGIPVAPPKGEEYELLPKKRNSPVGVAGDVKPEDAVLRTPPQGPRHGAYGGSASDDSTDSNYARSLPGIEDGSAESTSGYPMLPSFAGGGGSYTHGDHTTHATAPINLMKKPPKAYVDIKYPPTDTRRKNVNKSRQESSSGGSLVADGPVASSPRGQPKKMPNSKSKKVGNTNPRLGGGAGARGGDSGHGTAGSGDSYELGSPVPTGGKNRYDRGNSTDSSESGGARYAPGTMRFETLRENNTSSAEEIEVPASGVSAPPISLPGVPVSNVRERDYEDQSLIAPERDEDQSPIQPVLPTSATDSRTIPVAASNVNASAFLQQHENALAQTDPKPLSVDTQDDAANNSSDSWDDDDDGDGYTKQKQDEPKLEWENEEGSSSDN